MNKTFIETSEFTEWGNGEQADLASDQKKVLKSLAENYKRAAVKAAGLFNGGKS